MEKAHKPISMSNENLLCTHLFRHLSKALVGCVWRNIDIVSCWFCKNVSRGWIFNVILCHVLLEALRGRISR